MARQHDFDDDDLDEDDLEDDSADTDDDEADGGGEGPGWRRRLLGWGLTATAISVVLP